jgi:hypothetical protein
MPMGLFELVRLHECFRWPGLNAGEVAILTDYQLRDGIDRRSVVPMVRVFDPETVSPLLSRHGGSYRALADCMVEATKLERNLIDVGLDNLRSGYPHRGRKARFRISRWHAQTIHDALGILAGAKADELPRLDALFSYDPPFGTKLGTKPLGRHDGALY